MREIWKRMASTVESPWQTLLEWHLEAGRSPWGIVKGIGHLHMGNWSQRCLMLFKMFTGSVKPPHGIKTDRGPTGDQHWLEQQRKNRWCFRTSQVALEPKKWQLNCTVYLWVTLAPTDFHWVKSRTTCPTAHTRRIDRDVPSNKPNPKLGNYRGIREQWTSSKKQPDSCAPRCATLPLLARTSATINDRALG